ncbi:hypothetical protein ABIA32_004441 [Streptacidiphilus sp. MAP12-20]|uniref:hypothetical protein n=1 Tax=Streptacidiphilus sp. MAP12-20 TaxID=3156299 RepID=UPI00351923D9
MPRLTPSQLGLGTLAVVGPTVALLALSGAQGVLTITLLVLVGLTLGTFAATRRGRTRVPAGSRVVAQGSPPAVESIPERERVNH